LGKDLAHDLSALKIFFEKVNSERLYNRAVFSAYI